MHHTHYTSWYILGIFTFNAEPFWRDRFWEIEMKTALSFGEIEKIHTFT